MINLKKGKSFRENFAFFRISLALENCGNHYLWNNKTSNPDLSAQSFLAQTIVAATTFFSSKFFRLIHFRKIRTKIFAFFRKIFRLVETLGWINQAQNIWGNSARPRVRFMDAQNYKKKSSLKSF